MPDPPLARVWTHHLHLPSLVVVRPVTVHDHLGVRQHLLQGVVAVVAVDVVVVVCVDPVDVFVSVVVNDVSGQWKPGQPAEGGHWPTLSHDKGGQRAGPPYTGLLSAKQTHFTCQIHQNLCFHHRIVDMTSAEDP